MFSGPFVVMVGAMATDILKFGFLYLEFYIPYGKFLAHLAHCDQGLLFPKF